MILVSRATNAESRCETLYHVARSPQCRRRRRPKAAARLLELTRTHLRLHLGRPDTISSNQCKKRQDGTVDPERTASDQGDPCSTTTGKLGRQRAYLRGRVSEVKACDIFSIERIADRLQLVIPLGTFHAPRTPPISARRQCTLLRCSCPAIAGDSLIVRGRSLHSDDAASTEIIPKSNAPRALAPAILVLS